MFPLCLNKYPLNGVTVFVVPSFCLLQPQLATFPESGSTRGFFLLTGTCFVSTVASGMLRKGDWTEEKFFLSSEIVFELALYV